MTYNPNQPRHPKGSEFGGRWSDGSTSATASAMKYAGLSKNERTTQMGELLRQLKENEGFSESIHGNNPETGYMCSISNDQTFYPMETITEENLRQFVKQNWNTLLTDNYYFGGWVSPIKKVPNGYLDVSENIQDLHQTMIKALKRSQISVWDVVKGEEIVTKEYWKLFNKGGKK